MTNSFKEFKEKALHEQEEVFAILFLSPITIRIAYLIKKWNLNITPNQITFSRLYLFSPLIILCLFLAPILQDKIFYLLAIIFSYFFLLSDWLDGQLARGTNKVSKGGTFLDSVADRLSSIIFLTLLFSIGMWFDNPILVYGSICLFVLKTFHMMIITKVFYYKRNPDLHSLFTGQEARKVLGVARLESFLRKTNSFLNIKRWGCSVGGSERYFLSIIFPLILIILNLNAVVIVFSYILLIVFGISFIIRIKNLLD